MAFQSVPETAEINVIYTYNGETVQNVFYAEMSGGYTLANVQELADEVDIAVGENWLDIQPPEAVYQRIEVRGLEFQNDVFATANLNTGPGEDLSSALPNNVTISIKKTSGLTGRSARGRTYWIGIPQSQITASNENILASAFIAEVEVEVGRIRTRINTTGTWEAVLVSRFTNGAERPVGVTFVWTSTVCVNAVVDTQRGRLPS